MFYDMGNMLFYLVGNSPCIDAGQYIEDLLTDFEGDLRGCDGSSEMRGDGFDYDIGADEYYEVKSMVDPENINIYN